MKQPRTPFSSPHHHHPSSDLLSSSPNPNPNPNPNPHHKMKQPASSRKQNHINKILSKENSDPNTNTIHEYINSGGKSSGSPAGGVSKIRSPLPPRPPVSGGSLKRKLDGVGFDVGSGNGNCGSTTTDSGVKVIVRMRPLRKDKEDGDTIVEKLSNDSLTINGQIFTFDSVADTEASQMDIFHLVGAPLVENCLGGYSSTVFAYGQTGSGKTYTMWGPANALLEENLLSDQQGLTPRVFERLFARISEEQIKHADKQLKYQCRCSFLEIYNEQIRDLLDPGQKNLQIREDVKAGVYVENLTEESVTTMQDVIQILLKGLSNRRSGATSINAESSRSHSVFTCVVETRYKSTDGLSSFRTSRINLVDLAGSERQKLTGAAGDRLKEAGNINKSLSQLGNLINILAEVSQTGKQRHIPYRDSRLTFLLQESLGGNAKLAVICAISPTQSCKSETFSTLRFAQRAKAIKNKAVVNEVVEDDVNILREMIRQLKDELLRMKSNGSQTNPNGAYSNGWNARRSLNLLKFSLNRPLMLPHVDDDGDEVMEIDEEAVEKLTNQFGGEVGKSTAYTRRAEPIQSETQTQPLKEETHPILLSNTSRNDGLAKQDSDISDVSMEEALLEMEDKQEVDSGGMDVAAFSMADPSSGQVGARGTQDEVVTVSYASPGGDDCRSKDSEDDQLLPMETPIRDDSSCVVPLVHEILSDISNARTRNSSPSFSKEPTVPNLIIVPGDRPEVLQSPTSGLSPAIINTSRKSPRTLSTLTASQRDASRTSAQELGAHMPSPKTPNLSVVLGDIPKAPQSPTPSLSPRVTSTSRKSPRTSSMLTASQRDPNGTSVEEVGIHMPSPKISNKSTSCAVVGPSSKSDLSSTEHLAASLHRGLEVLDNHRHTSPRHSPFRYSLRPADIEAISPARKMNVGVQTLPEDGRLADGDNEQEYVCSKCRSENVQEALKEGNANSNLQLVPVDGSPLSGEKAKKLVPKAVEKVLTGAIRREMALEEFCGKQASEIMQLNRLVQQYKHERECNTIIGRMREDKIIRLENLMDGVLPTQDFLDEELIFLRKEHELLKEKYDNHPEMLRTQIELKRVQDEFERYRNFFDMGERDVLLEEIQDLRTQLQFYTENSSKPIQWRSSLPKLTYPCEPSTSPPLNAIPESSEDNAEEKLEQERLHWTELESKWISLAEELRMELESSHSVSEKLKHELESERKCSEELKEALQLAMEGQARTLEQYADLEEKHMELLARQRKIQEGIDDVKRAASRAGVRGAESKFINALAAQISALKVEREKERRYLRDENKVLQEQLRDTAEAVQAAGELLVRLKEAEEAVASAQKRAATAEEETVKAYKQIDKLKKKHEMKIQSLNHKTADYQSPKHASENAYQHTNVAKYDIEDHLDADDQRWKQEFDPFYSGLDSGLSKFGEQSSWFSGYDRCNI